MAAYDPTQKTTNVVLSNLNRTADVTVGSTEESVRSVTGHSSGKWYAEVTPDIVNALLAALGISNKASALPDGGNNANSYIYFYDGSTNFNGTNTAHGSYAYATAGEIIRIALDMDNAKLWFGDSTGWIDSGDPAAGTTPTYSSVAAGTWYLTSYSFLLSTENKWTLNTEGPFNYTVPSGFSAWDTAAADTGLAWIRA